MDIEIRTGKLSDSSKLLELYKEVAKVSDGIIRKEHEINENFIHTFLEKSIDNGLILIGIYNNEIVGEIHAYTPKIYAFQHLLTDLTIIVDPKRQGMGIGRSLFESFLGLVETNLGHILRVELYTREHNKRNVKFYESLGFKNEGRQENKIYISNTVFETPLHMAWFNPNYGK